ncbi:hypothetical protein ID854_00500 [Xenorhabdus sp. M]|uniref:Uncharacterized protein n=1 Tax=Xenorhabdus szentirmaii TaxID=290112 RepID=A0AAW3YRL8_9GAMM|nr:hypothetical protein [Xenorhabdus sp. M]MBD2798978.1 hypothetical protein [Xenorhabdus sp. M]
MTTQNRGITLSIDTESIYSHDKHNANEPAHSGPIAKQAGLSIANIYKLDISLTGNYQHLIEMKK